MMADDRSQVLQSPAYAALTPSGKRALHLIEGEVMRSGGIARLSHNDFKAFGMARSSSCLRQD